METFDNTERAVRNDLAVAGSSGMAEAQGQPFGWLPFGVVQREWEHTLERVRERCEVQDCTALVKAGQYAHVIIRKTDSLDIAQVESILFENLLFSPWARVEHQHSYLLSGQWLWKWRRSTAWTADPVGHLFRLAPDAPRTMCTYRFNVIYAEG